MNHLYEINQTSATHNKQWDLLKLLCKDKNVDEVNKKLDEIALQHKKEITVQQDIAKQRVIDQLYEIHKVAEEIDRTQIELQEKINKFCDDISEFIKNSLNIDDKVVAGDALSISIS
ncbi:unnamed protein product [Schistosoma rodhaini]|uniref:Chemotaxis protein n=1 Tax=Schistosoma mansoni TaxID=6183 RepID=A0A5K4FCA6_SCHMA|nr:unnamed protein product [Schistosoma rodhaini]